MSDDKQDPLRWWGIDPAKKGSITCVGTPRQNGKSWQQKAIEEATLYGNTMVRLNGYNDKEEDTMNEQKLTKEEFEKQQEEEKKVREEFEAADTYKVTYDPKLIYDDCDKPLPHPYPYKLMKKKFDDGNRYQGMVWVSSDGGSGVYDTPDASWTYVDVCRVASVEDAKEVAKIDSEMPITFEVEE